MIATEPIPVPEELRQVQAHQGGLDEVVSGEIRCDIARRQHEQTQAKRWDRDMER